MYTDVYGVQFSDDKKTLIKCPQEFEGVYKIPDGVEEIDDMAFANTHITSVVIPDTVHRIGSGAFSTCYQLRAIELPPHLEELGDHAFVFSNIESIAIPGSVKVVGGGAFMTCEKLRQVVISEGVACIESYAFNDCTSLESVTLPQSVSYIGSCAFSECRKLKPIALPEVLDFCASAFDSPEKVILPADTSRIRVLMDDAEDEE